MCLRTYTIPVLYYFLSAGRLQNWPVTISYKQIPSSFRALYHDHEISGCCQMCSKHSLFRLFWKCKGVARIVGIVGGGGGRGVHT